MSKNEFHQKIGPHPYLLVVEDDMDIREAVQEFLEDEGYKVATAIHGQDALHFLISNKDIKLPRCIILDISMPIMNGIDFLHAIENKHPTEFGHIPVIIATANPHYLTHEAVKKCFSRIKKPYDFDDLINSIKVHFA